MPTPISAQTKIQAAVIQLIQTKGFGRLTVTDIIKLAHINRSTFYLHYQDKFDLLKRYEDQLLTDIDRNLINNLTQTMQFQPQGQTTPQIYPVVTKIVTYIWDNFALIQALMSPNGDPHFEPQLRALLAQTIDTDLYLVKGVPQLTNAIPEKYARELVLAGFFDIIKVWLQQSEPETPSEIAAIIMKTRYLSPYDLLGLTQKQPHD